MRFDVVDAMTIGTNRGLRVAMSDGLSVDTLHELALDWAVTLSTRLRNVELEDRRLLIVGGQNFVSAVAIGANRGLRRSIGDGLPVDTLLV